MNGELHPEDQQADADLIQTLLDRIAELERDRAQLGRDQHAGDRALAYEHVAVEVLAQLLCGFPEGFVRETVDDVYGDAQELADLAIDRIYAKVRPTPCSLCHGRGYWYSLDGKFLACGCPFGKNRPTVVD